MNLAQGTDATDLKILEALQQDFPLVAEPWNALAGQLRLTEDELLGRLERLRGAGILRGISPIIESRPLGITAATLVALPVPEDRIGRIANIISGYPGVSHNFRRDHRYSLWFTLSGRDPAELERTLDEILERTGIPKEEILNLPTVRKIKIDVRFPVTRDGSVS